MSVPAFLAGGIPVLAGATLAYAVRGRSATLLAPSVWRGPSDEPRIALTFDDGPSVSTPRVLDLLARYAAPSTFFVCGMHVRRQPQIAQAVLAAGHELGNHTDHHALLCGRSPAFIARELTAAQRTIEDHTGATARFFRPPYGARWFGLRAAQREHELLGVMWTEIARDWTLPGPAIASRLQQRAANGAIFCFHDGRARNPNPDITASLDALKRLLPIWRDQGFRFVTVGELLCLPTSPNVSLP